MEELLSTILNKDVEGYMREANACYGAGAYRGCIVLSYIALFDHLRAELRERAKFNKVADTISKAIEKSAMNEKVFENEMADQLLASGLISAADRKRLKTIQDIRNSAAHPSGIDASAEEARFVYYDTISCFLSKPILTSMAQVERVMERIEKSSLFPSNAAPEIRGIVEDEITDLHKDAYSVLISKLISETTKGSTTAKKNAQRFIHGIALLKNEHFQVSLRKMLIKERCHDDEFHDCILEAISSDGALVAELDPITLVRIRAIVLGNASNPDDLAMTKSRHPTRQFASIVQFVDGKNMLKSFEDFTHAILSKYPYAPTVVKAVVESEPLHTPLVEIWKKKCASTDFATANSFAEALGGIDSSIPEIMSSFDALQILVSCLDSAKMGSYDMIELVDSDFSSAPNLLAHALKAFKPDAAKFKKMSENYEHLNLEKTLKKLKAASQ